MSDVPFFGSVKAAGKIAATPAPQTQKYRALQNVAGGLNNITKAAQNIYAQEKSLEEAEAVQAARRDMQMMQKEQELYMQQNQDESSWEKNWENKLSAYKQKHGAREFINPSRKLEYQGLHDQSERTILDLKIKAHAHREDRFRTGIMADIDELAANGKHDSAIDLLVRNAPSAGLLPEQTKGLINNLRRQKNQYEVDYMREQDPFAHEKNLMEGKYTLNDVERQQELKKTKGEIKRYQADRTDEAVDGIYSGKYTTPEQIEENFSRLRPKVRHSLKNQITQLQDQKYQEKLRTPEMQNQIAGEISGLINKYDPTGEEFDEEYVSVLTKIEQLGDGPLKDEYKNQLKSMRSGKKKEITSATDLALKQVDEMADAGLFGKVEPPKKIEVTSFELLHDGFLDDQGKLEQLGFSEGDAKKITKIDNLKEQASLFKSLWNNEVNTMTGDQDVDDLAKHLAASGSLTEVMSKYDDPLSVISTAEKEVALNRKVGKIKNEFMQWRKLNPNASQAEIGTKLEQIGVDVSAGDTDMSTSWRKPATSSVPDTMKLGKGSYRVSNKTRDQITGFSSKAGSRMIALDFNDADNKSARGIEIKVPSDASSDELNFSRAWARETQAFFKAHGVSIPIRRGDGIKKDGSGISGVFHTEPFFASNHAARKVIEEHGAEYAEILGRTLGNINGANFIPPHKQGAKGGTTSNGISERDFALKYIIPHL